MFNEDFWSGNDIKWSDTFRFFIPFHASLTEKFQFSVVINPDFFRSVFTNFHIIPGVYMCLHFICISVLTVIYKKKYLKLINIVSEVFCLSVNLTTLLML